MQKAKSGSGTFQNLRKLKKLFPETKNEAWVQKHSCATLERGKIPIFGKIYITPNFLLFKSIMKKECIHLKDIQFIQKVSVAFVFPSGLQIVTVDGRKFSFLGLQNRHKICMFLENQIEISRHTVNGEVNQNLKPSKQSHAEDLHPAGTPQQTTEISQETTERGTETETTEPTESDEIESPELSPDDSQEICEEAEIPSTLQEIERRIAKLDENCNNLILQETRKERVAEVQNEGDKWRNFFHVEKCRALVLIASVLGALIFFPGLEKRPLGSILFSGLLAILVDMVEPNQTVKDLMSLMEKNLFASDFCSMFNVEIIPASRSASILITTLLLFVSLELLPMLKSSFVTGFLSALVLTSCLRPRTQ